MARILQERERDSDEVEQLFDLAFAPGRATLSSYRLRGASEPIADLCLCARDDFDVIVGAIRYWPIRIEAEELSWPALLLGPLAIHPTRQGEGIGAELMLESLDRARALGWERVLLVGDEPYYRRFGFRRAAVDMPGSTNPDRILMKRLIHDDGAAVKGRAVVAAPSR